MKHQVFKREFIIMDRYQFTKIDGNTQTRRTTMLPNIPEQSTDLFIISRDGDRLDLLANEFYNDSSLWWVIAQANGIGKGTVIIDPGQQIRIPSPVQGILLDLIRAAEEDR